ncbi:MAG: aminotransferase class IV [Solirubrobacterales bacterium]
MPVTAHPDPNRGVFETLLVVGGRPIEVDAHLARLGASLRTLFDLELGDEARKLVAEEAASLDLGRVRVTAQPQRNGAIALDAGAAEVDPALVFPAAERAVALRSAVMPGGLGAHKWADRSQLERLQAGFAGTDGTADVSATASVEPEGESDEPVPLLLDRDEAVLEGSRANLFAVRDGALATPRLDGRILPGVARARVIDVAQAAGIEVQETDLTRVDLLGGDEVFLSGSVRGVEPVRSLDGSELRPAGAITRLVARELRRRWFAER